MADKITEFISNPLNSLLLATVVGILTNLLTGFITGKYFEQTKKLWWSVDTEWFNHYYFSKTDKLKMTYVGLDNKRKVIKDSLSVLRFVFWSNGNETLFNSDVSSKEPLVIYLGDDTELLEIRSIKSSNPTIQLRPIRKDTLSIDFEYLELNQGSVFDLVVLGYVRKASLSGILKGGKVLTKRLRTSAFMALPFFPRKFKQYTRIKMSKWIFTFFFVISLWTSFLLIQSAMQRPDEKDSYVLLIQFVFAAVIPYLAIIYPFWTVPLVPKELNDFYEKIT